MIPYRTRRALSRLGITLLILTVVAALALVCWFLWLNRYVVYTRDGVRLDFSAKPTAGGITATAPTAGQKVPVLFLDQEDLFAPEDTALAKISGIHITRDMMLNGKIAALSQQIQTLPTGTAVMIDIKDIQGRFFYNSSLGNTYGNINADDLEKMISDLNRLGYYLIARIPAFQDNAYGAQNVDDGIFLANRKGLWIDADGTRCYWLNPAAEGTLSHVAQIISELKTLGFDEVAMYDFQIPDTDEIYFPYDKAEVIATAAQTLVTVCANDRFAVSFVSDDADFPLPEGRCRLYMENIPAADLAYTVDKAAVSQPDIRMVFLTELMDTRFDAYGVLRPLTN